MAKTTWSNWSGVATSNPTRIAQPSSEGEVQEIIRTAAESAGRVKAVGAGHSFTSVAQTDGTRRCRAYPC